MPILNETELNKHVRQLLTDVAVIQSRLNADEIAMAVQNNEYARRLEELNHAQDRADKLHTNFVSRDLFDQRAQEVNRRMDEIITGYTVLSTKNATIAAVLALLIAIGSVAATVWNGMHN